MRRVTIRDGKPGTADTLKLMSALVLQGKSEPAVRSLALELVKRLPPKAYGAETAAVGEYIRKQAAIAVHQFVRDHIRYVRDVRNVETLHTAKQVAAQAQGDCDDKSILASALLEALGARTRLVAIGFNKRVFAHVFPQVWLGRWVNVETTEDWPLGKGPSLTPTLVMLQDNEPGAQPRMVR
jgi:transglutaminase-like putative cysteine protease